MYFFLVVLTEPARMYVNKHCVFYCNKSKAIHGGTPVQTIMYISITKGLCTIERIAKTAQYHNYVSFFVIYLRFIITLVKDMFDLQIDKKKKEKNCLQ
jgi:hypothetical protein